MSLTSSHGIHGRSTRHPRADQGVTPGIELKGDPFAAAGPSSRVMETGSEHIGSSSDSSNRIGRRPSGRHAIETDVDGTTSSSRSGASQALPPDAPLVMSPSMQLHEAGESLSPARRHARIADGTAGYNDDNTLSGQAGSRGSSVSHSPNNTMSHGTRKNVFLPDIDTRSPAHEPMRSNSGKRRGTTQDIGDTSKRPTSPHITIATPTSARFHLNHNQQQSLQTDQPERAYSLPTGQGRKSSVSPSRANAHANAPVRQNSLRGVAAQAAHNVVDAMTGGRSTPSNALAYANSFNRPGSASSASRRRSENVNSPQENTHNAALGVFVGDDAGDDLYDDEEGKGHGIHRATAGPNSGRWTPTIFSSIIKKAEGRFSPVSPFAHGHYGVHADGHQAKVVSPGKSTLVLADEPEALTEEDIKHAEINRRTPACYRPANESRDKEHAVLEGLHLNGTRTQSPSHVKAHPLSHAHKISISSTSNSSHSINMGSPPMSSHSRHSSMHASVSPTLLGTRITGTQASNASPLVVPQARRGAMNLRPLRRRKRNHATTRQKRTVGPSVPVHIRFIHFIRLLCSCLIHPLGTCAHAKRSFISTLRSIDHAFRDPRTGARVWRPSWLNAYIPLLIWLVISLSSTFTVLIWHTQVFQGLDRLSLYLQGMGMTGRLILGSLIFLTTFPPLPLYSTLIILCGFTFGLWQGFIISYIAALSGAITVFLLSRSLLKSWMLNLLNKSGGLKRVVRAIEKRPKLLFLVRLAPYPYNLMNTLLASSPTLTLKTYTTCTALALPKLLVHCGLGTTIKNFAAYNGAAKPLDPDFIESTGTPGSSATIIGKPAAPDASASETAELIKHIFGFAGVGLCIGIFIYLLRVARRAVDEELDEEEEGEDDYELVLSDEEDEMVETNAERVRLSASHASSNEFVIDDDDDRADEHDQTPGPGRAAWSRRDQGTAHRDGKGASSYDSAMSRLNAAPPRAESTHRFAMAGDGATPMFVVPPQLDELPYESGSDTGRSYFGRQGAGAGATLSTHPRALGTSSKGHSSSNLSDSQGSLADSIIEMEKHASLLEGRPSQSSLETSSEQPRSSDAKGTLLAPSVKGYATGHGPRTAPAGKGASGWPGAARDLLDASHDDDDDDVVAGAYSEAERKPFMQARPGQAKPAFPQYAGR